MMINQTFILLATALLPFTGLAQQKQLQTFPLASVQLLESPFRQAQQVDKQYIMALDPDRLLAPYLREAGLTPKAKSYGNWENTGLDGHIGGHYLTALSLMYAATGDEQVLQRLNYMLDELEKCQQQNGNGYIGGVPGGNAMWEEIAKGKIDAGGFSLNKKWVPLYNIHKPFAGLRDAWLYTGNEKAKEMLVKYADWHHRLVSNLSDQQVQDMLRSEHGGINEVLADVAEITGDEKYLELARRFSHQAILDPLLAKQNKLTGQHANTQIPKVIGYKRVAEVGGNQAWAGAADFFWRTVIDQWTVSIGGNSVREHFHPANNFSSMVESKEGPETCNTYNMLKLTKQLHTSNPSPEYINYYERALYNHILSSQHPERGGFVYFTPMRPRHYRVYSQPHEGFWCCVGSGLENHGKYGEFIYAHHNQDLYLNLFIPSTLDWQEQGLTLTQQTTFPFEEKTELKLQLKKARKFSFYIRKPEWVGGGAMQVRVNNKEVKAEDAGNGYVQVNRKWKNGDVVSVSLPMQTKVERLPDNSPWVSFVHGPIVLAAATDKTDMPGLLADDSRMGHIADGKLYPVEEAPMLIDTGKGLEAGLQPVPGKPMTFTASELIGSDKYKNVELVPFFQVHDARYMVYWPVATPEELVARKEAIRMQEEAKLALEARTVDQVAPGEQQPESDHNFQGEKTEAGVYLDRHWRTATDWFSYDLRNPDRQARTLRITYFGGDRDRNFDILLNNNKIATVKLDGSKGREFFDVDYEIPVEIRNRKDAGNLTLKFVAHQGSTAGGIYYVRLLKQE